ncbi:MAG: hypothetical protein JJ938_13245 [Roseicyclus sp.]|nr:hypothetical protein [Roseicyclus sp.]
MMASYESAGKSNPWMTPPYVFEALGIFFDIDVAAPRSISFVPAWTHFNDCGLQREWFGTVWMNPPFGHQSTKRLWLRNFSTMANQGCPHKRCLAHSEYPKLSDRLGPRLAKRTLS